MVASSSAMLNSCRAQRCFCPHSTTCHRMRRRTCCVSQQRNMRGCLRTLQQTTVTVGMSAALLCSSQLPALALQGPLGKPVMPDRYDLVQPDKRTVAESVASAMGFIDSDKDGIITKLELKTNLPSIRRIADEATIDYIHDLYDLNMDGTLQTNEVLTAAAIEACVSEDGVSQALFEVFDKDNNQFISINEFKDALGDVVSEQTSSAVDHLFRKSDVLGDNNKVLDEDEFVEAMNMLRMLLTD